MRAHTEYRNGNNNIIDCILIIEFNLEFSSLLVYTAGRVC